MTTSETTTIRVISDTHQRHNEIKIDPCDILIHCGDAGRIGDREEILNFVRWFENQPADHLIYVPGNHDQCLDKANKLYDEDLHSSLVNRVFPIHYLEDREVTIGNFHFYGMPWTPEFFDWAFMGKPSGDYPEYGRPLLRDKCEQISSQTDILICHGPPAGIMDRNTIGKSVGSLDLRIRIEQVKPKSVIFGHIHGCRGHEVIDGIDYINASSLNENYDSPAKPVDIYCVDGTVSDVHV
jgi:Icc-related predicted phosphoesterase